MPKPWDRGWWNRRDNFLERSWHLLGPRLGRHLQGGPGSFSFYPSNLSTKTSQTLTNCKIIAMIWGQHHLQGEPGSFSFYPHVTFQPKQHQPGLWEWCTFSGASCIKLHLPMKLYLDILQNIKLLYYAFDYIVSKTNGELLPEIIMWIVHLVPC